MENYYEFVKEFEKFTDSWWPYVISLLISVVSAIRLYVGGKYYTSPARVEKRNIIITGGSGGIGLETAKELAQRGANLILAVRNGEKGINALEQVRNVNKDANVKLKLLDVSELTSIRNFVDEIEKEYDKIDVLINNAGVICDIGKKSSDGNDLTFSTNYLGPFLLTHLLSPLLLKSDNGRVINISALAHYNGKLNLTDEEFGKSSTPQEAFAQSKLALTIFTKYMAQLFKNSTVTFNSVSPGLVRNTGHLANFSSLTSCFLTRLSVWPWVWLFLKTPKQGCQSIVYLAVEPSIHKVTGCYFSDCEIKEPADLVNDLTIAKELYEKTCSVVGIEPEKRRPNTEAKVPVK